MKKCEQNGNNNRSNLMIKQQHKIKQELVAVKFCEMLLQPNVYKPTGIQNVAAHSGLCLHIREVKVRTADFILVVKYKEEMYTEFLWTDILKKRWEYDTV
jgi:hypothetical protein